MKANDQDSIPQGRLIDVSHARRDMLKRGGIAAVGAAIAGGAVLGRATPARAAVSGRNIPLTTDGLDVVIAVFAGGTLLDFAGPSEVFHQFPNARIRFASLEGGAVTLQYGVVFGETERLADITRTDLILVPGGPDLSAAITPTYLAEIGRLARSARYVTSVCTGSLVLAAAGVLNGKRSACHWSVLNRLAEFGAIPVPSRFVTDDNGRFMSGGGVTSGIDFALNVCARLRGQLAAEFAQLMIEYDPDPPFHSGHPSGASPEVLAMAEKALPGSTIGLAQIPGLP